MRGVYFIATALMRCTAAGSRWAASIFFLHLVGARTLARVDLLAVAHVDRALPLLEALDLARMGVVQLLELAVDRAHARVRRFGLLEQRVGTLQAAQQSGRRWLR
jgi:hypothetical protein